MNAFESIRQGIKEALDFTHGKKASVKVHEIEVTPIDAISTRKGAGQRVSKDARVIKTRYQG